MGIDSILQLIPRSQSDNLLSEWGYDLLREYFSIAEQLPRTASPPLELATGTGRMCAVLSSIFPWIITGDISLQEIPRVKQRVPAQFLNRIQYVQLDMEQLPFRSDSVQSIVCMNTLHEVTDPTVCLQEMIRIVRYEGTFAVGDFNRTGFDVMQKIHEQVYHNDHDEGVITHREIEAILSSAFQSIRIFTTTLNTTYFASHKR